MHFVSHALGQVMGHELTHGFDDQGRQYDGTGKLTNWWTNASLAGFEQRTDCMSAQYSAYEVLPGVHVNGNLTLGENIADNGGVKTAFKAFENHLHPHAHAARAARKQRSRMMPELSNEQLFFLSYGQVWWRFVLVLLVDFSSPLWLPLRSGAPRRLTISSVCVSRRIRTRRRRFECSHDYL